MTIITQTPLLAAPATPLLLPAVCPVSVPAKHGLNDIVQSLLALPGDQRGPVIDALFTLLAATGEFIGGDLESASFDMAALDYTHIIKHPAAPTAIAPPAPPTAVVDLGTGWLDKKTKRDQAQAKELFTVSKRLSVLLDAFFDIHALVSGNLYKDGNLMYTLVGNLFEGRDGIKIESRTADGRGWIRGEVAYDRAEARHQRDFVREAYANSKNQTLVSTKTNDYHGTRGTRKRTDWINL